MLSFLALSSCSFLAVLAPALQTKFGAAVALSDVNGDGFDDVIVGEPLYSSAFEGEGRVLVYLGSSAGPAPAPAWIRRGLQARRTSARRWQESET